MQGGVIRVPGWPGQETGRAGGPGEPFSSPFTVPFKALSEAFYMPFIRPCKGLSKTL